MQTSERSTRSTRKFVPEQVASPDPEDQSDTGQYMCIECGETFDTRLELNSHRQSHVTKKQFTCAHCGRGFHHQVFLQMHERSHEGGASGVKTLPPPRVISTRSSKVADVVLVKPTYPKPQLRLNSIVQFKNEQNVSQTFTPKEFLTRRSHGAAPVSQETDGPEEQNLFQLQISKYTDTAVHLMDSFGNSIEILADVFNTYTIGEAEENGVTTDTEEAHMTNTSNEKSFTEEPSASPQTEANEPPPPDAEIQLSPVTSQSIAAEKLNTNGTGLPVPAQPEQMESPPSSETIEPASNKGSLLPSSVSEENGKQGHTVESSSNLPAEEDMDISPEDAAGPKSPQEVHGEAETLLGAQQNAEPTSTADEPMASTDSQEENPSIMALPVDPPSRNEDPSLLDDPGSLKDAARSVPKTSEDQPPDESAEEMIEDVEQNQSLTLLKPDAEIRPVSVPPIDSPPEPQETVKVSAYISPLEGSVLEESTKEDADLCNSLPMNRDNVSLPPESASIGGRSAEEPGAQNDGAALTSPTSEERPERIEAEADLQEKPELQSPSTEEKAEKDVRLETDICTTSKDGGEVSISQHKASISQGEASVAQGEVSISQHKASISQREVSVSQHESSISQGEACITQGEASIPERGLDSKEPEKPCSLLAEPDILHDDELVIDDKRDNDLFERDIFPLEVCGKGLASIQEDQNIVCRREAHRTKMVQEKENDICLNSSDMTYISESEMIKLLEQDKDDIADDEPMAAEAEQEPELSSNAKESRPCTSPVTWNGDQRTGDDILTSKHCDLSASLEQNTSKVQRLSNLPTLQAPPEERMDTDSCLPLNFLTNDEPRTGDIEPQDPTKSMLTQDSVSKEHLGFTETSSSSNNADLLHPERGLPSGDQKNEPCAGSTGNLDVNPAGDAALSTIEDPNSEENLDVLVTVEDNDCDDKVEQINALESPAVNESGRDKPQTRTPDHKDLVPATVCSIEPEQTKTLERESKTLASSQSEPFPDGETENPPADVLDYMQTTSEDNDDHSNTSSSERRDLKTEGMLNKRLEPGAIFLQNDDIRPPEQTTDPSSDRFSKTLSTPKKAESKPSTANADLAGLEGNGVLKDKKEDLEKASPKADLVSEEMEEDDGTGTKQGSHVSSIDRPVCQDSLEDAELIENEEDHTDTPSKPMGAGGECLKCGRKLRRGRKELVWLPVCFKCRKAAKRLERLSNQTADGLEALKSRREESLSSELSGDRLRKGISEKAASILDSLVAADEKEALSSGAKKRYKCPKCDETFRIPALLAGHIKCHTLPQCLTCGCQIPLKYKTKRIPRRCQKCFQQLKEKMRAEKVGEGSGGEGSSTSDNEEADRNPDDDDDVGSDEDLCIALQKAKRKPLKSVKQSRKIHDDDVFMLGRSHKGKPVDDEEVDSFTKDPEMESSDDLDTSDQNIGLPDSDKPRLCPQCSKAFPCNRSLNLHLLSHTGIQCETCGCRLPKRRRVGRWSRKCRSCRLQMKDKLLNDSEDEMSVSGDKPPKQNAASLRLKAKQSKMAKNAKIQSVIKKKKELKWMNMLLAVKGLMDKSRKKKENALKAADLSKKDGESSEAEKCDASSAENTGSDQPTSDMEKAGPSKLSSASNKGLAGTPKPGRKCLYTEKNIIKVEENDVLPYIPSDGSSSTAFIKQEETWQCLECIQSWPNSEALVNHQHSHTSDQSFTCPQCPQVFSSEEYLDIHSHAHDDDRPFRCPECDKTFSKRNHLGVHMRVHAGSRPYACPDCPCRFRQKVTLIAHRYSHRNYQLLFTKPFQCSVCSKSFKQKERLVVHERLHTGECPFSCKDCDQVFPSKSRLYVHRKMHKICDASSSEPNLSQEASEGQPFKCQDCGKICTTKASFVLHCRVHRLSSIPMQSIKRENEEGPAFTCKQCNKVFASKYSLRMHLKNHSAHKATAKSEMNLDPKECFPCKDCDKICSTKASLVLHHRVHKSPSASEQSLVIKVEPDTPSYVCKVCNKVCTTKRSLVFHRKVHKTPMGADTKTPPFRCKDCDMVCSTKASFVLHRKVHRTSTSNQQSPKAGGEPRSYNCRHCDMVCTTKASFALHNKVHKSLSTSEENLKPDEEPQSYTCKHCDMVCSTKASFALHSKVHRELINEQSPKVMEEPQSYNCKYCDMVCTTKASFVLHSKVHRSLFGDELKTPEEPQSYNCKHCDMVCSTKGGFVLHSKVHRLSSASEESPKTAEEIKSYSCKECDMVCSTKGSFVLHSRVHKGGHNLQADSEGSAFPCKDCNKVCSTKASFILHRRVHKASGSKGDGEEPAFQCKECGKIYSSKGRLSAHRGRVHEDTSGQDQNADNESNAELPKKSNEEKPYPCTICGLRFMTLKVLVRHKAVHGERTVTPCIHCGKQFLYMKSLFNHIKICQSKVKGKKRLLKKVAAKRKVPKDGGSTSSDGESAQKKPKMTEKQKALKAAQKLKNKNLMAKAKKAAASKEKGKDKAAGVTKTKEKRTNVDGDDGAEGEGKKTATEKQSDEKQEKPSDPPTAKEPTPKKNVPKGKKEPAKDKPHKAATGGAKKWRALTVSTIKKKNLLIGGKKKLLTKKKVQLKPKAGGKAGKD